MRLLIPGSLLLSICIFCSCAGPRNIHSTSPFVSPVSLEKGSTAIEASYFTHGGQTNVPDSVSDNHDNALAFSIEHMVSPKTLVFGSMDVKEESNHFRDSIALAGDPSYNAYDGGFDSSIVFGKRYTASVGVEFFSEQTTNISKSLAITMGYHQVNMNESGLLMRNPYKRFYKLNQVSLSVQGNLLFKVTKRLDVAWIMRITVLNSFKAHTDYSTQEKFNSGLRDNRVYGFFCPTGFYIHLKPFKNIPFYLNSQFFNDVAFWNRSSAKYEPGRTFIKGTGVSTGMQYVFN